MKRFGRCAGLVIAGFASLLILSAVSGRAEDKPADESRRCRRAENRTCRGQIVALRAGRLAAKGAEVQIDRTRIRHSRYEGRRRRGPSDRHGSRRRRERQHRAVDQSVAQPDGSATKNSIPEAQRTKKIGDVEIQYVDLSGNYKDMRPADPSFQPVVKEKYRMLAAIVVAPKLGNYFFKFYGPRQTVSDHADEFWKMIDGFQKKP